MPVPPVVRVGDIDVGLQCHPGDVCIKEDNTLQIAAKLVRVWIGDPGPDIVSDEEVTPYANRFEEGVDPFGRGCRVITADRLVRVTLARKVQSDHIEILREERDDPPPRINALRKSSDQHHGRACTGAQMVKTDAV
ncbi:hypothetical protein D3C71_1721440 [compost metagenome]